MQFAVGSCVELGCIVQRLLSYPHTTRLTIIPPVDTLDEARSGTNAPLRNSANIVIHVHARTRDAAASGRGVPRYVDMWIRRTYEWALHGQHVQRSASNKTRTRRLQPASQ
jgi:hypothetical protein